MRIGIDLMSSDNGAKCFSEVLNHNSFSDVFFTVYGTEEACSLFSNDIEKVICSEVISMEDGLLSIKRKKNSSLMVLLKDLAEGKVDGALTAGSSGALLVGAEEHVGRIEKVERGCFVAGLPSSKGNPVYLLDMGANSECTEENLLQFGLLGEKYAKSMGVKEPKVALLNNGTEKIKGDSIHKKAYKLLQEAGLDFVGNIEGRTILSGEADVVVTDGFSGNIALKSMEGTAFFMFDELKAAFGQNIFTKLCALVMKKHLRAIKHKADYSSVGGAALIGYQKPIVKAHGASNETALKSAVEQLIALVRNKELFEL